MIEASCRMFLFIFFWRKGDVFPCKVVAFILSSFYRIEPYFEGPLKYECQQPPSMYNKKKLGIAWVVTKEDNVS